MTDGRTLLLLCLTSLAACEQCPPPAPDGGTPKVRRDVDTAVARFYEALGPTQICVTRLSLEETRAERAGHYSRAFRAVAVDSDTSLGPDRVATHELCHALDHQHAIRMRQDNLWDYDVPREDLELTWTVMGEAFADTCEVGPLSLQLVGESCPADTQGSRAFQVLQNWFPEPVVGVGATELAFEPVSSWVTHTPILKLAVTGTRERVVRIDVDTVSELRSLTVDLDTGQPAPMSLPSPRTADPELPHGWALLDHAGDGADRSLSIARMTATNGGSVERLLWTDATGQQSLGCPKHLEVPFYADGELWSAWVEGDTVHWGRWVDLTPNDAPSGRDKQGGKADVERL